METDSCFPFGKFSWGAGNLHRDMQKAHGRFRCTSDRTLAQEGSWNCAWLCFSDLSPQPCPTLRLQKANTLPLHTQLLKEREEAFLSSTQLGSDFDNLD